MVAKLTGLAARVVDRRSVTLNELDAISMDDAVVLAANSEVVRDQLDRALVRRCHSGWARATEATSAAIASAPATSSLVVVVAMMSSFPEHSQ